MTVNKLRSKYIVMLSEDKVYRGKKTPGLGIPWWSSGYNYTLSLWRAWVQSLVGELKSHKPCDTSKKKGKNKTKESYWLREMEVREGITVLFWVVREGLTDTVI